jgi:hypothetical protein
VFLLAASAAPLFPSLLFSCRGPRSVFVRLLGTELRSFAALQLERSSRVVLWQAHCLLVSRACVEAAVTKKIAFGRQEWKRNALFVYSSFAQT